MPTQPKPKPRPVGRPKLAKGQAKGAIIPVRFSPEDRQRVERAAKASKQTISEWTRRMLMDFNMTEDDLKKTVGMFGKARDAYSEQGNQSRAKECDLAIALVHSIQIELSKW